MLNKLNRGDGPRLLRAIKHWERIANGSKNDAPIPEQCALCQKYWDKRDCEGCPIYEDTGEKHCVGTPYVAAEKEWRLHQSKGGPNARAMLAYLVGLYIRTTGKVPRIKP